MGTPAVRALFGAVVLATAAAFFVTQQLKGEVPVVLRFATSPDSISPNGDGVRERALVGFDLSEPATVTFDVIDDDGRRIRRLFDDRGLAGDEKHRVVWNGRDDDGRVVPDGSYRMRVIRKGEGRIVDSIKKVRVDTKPPRVELLSARPNVISPGNAGERPTVRIRYRGPRNVAPEFRIFRTDGGPTRVVLRFRGDDTRSAEWHGLLREGPAEDGDYAFTVRVRDRAGNEGTAPGEVPTTATARAGTGVAVRHLTLSGPLGVVAAGSLVPMAVGPRERAFHFALSRLGSRRVVRRGRRVGGRFRIRLPRRARTGVYVVRVTARGRRARWPLAVAGPPAGGRRKSRSRALVVLPAVTWQGLNRFDDDLDGFADTLESAHAVRLDRPFRQGLLPPRFSSEVAPLLGFLDRERLPYDLTTDVSLARGEGPALGRAPGAAFAGSELWLPGPLAGALRRYVSGGGRLASFGRDSLRRRVSIRRDALRGPSRPSRRDVLGEETRPLTAPPAPLVVSRDRIGLFRGVGTLFGTFSHVERSIGLPQGGRLLAAAGRDPDGPALVAYRLGGGLVVRVGAAPWTSLLGESRLGLEVPQVTRRILRLLARGR